MFLLINECLGHDRLARFLFFILDNLFYRDNVGCSELMTNNVEKVHHPAPASSRTLTAPEFHQLAQVPPVAEWFANITNPNTRRAYSKDLQEFMGFAGITRPKEFRLVIRAQVLAWRADLERHELAGSTLRRKLAALSSLFEYLCERNAVSTNPVDGVKRPKVESYKGKTPALSDALTRNLLKLPAGRGLQQLRDRALLSGSCSTTDCAARRFARWRCRVSIAAAECHICASTGKAARSETFPCTLVAINC